MLVTRDEAFSWANVHVYPRISYLVYGEVFADRILYIKRSRTGRIRDFSECSTARREEDRENKQAPPASTDRNVQQNRQNPEQNSRRPLPSRLKAFCAV